VKAKRKVRKAKRFDFFEWARVTWPRCTGPYSFSYRAYRLGLRHGRRSKP